MTLAIVVPAYNEPELIRWQARCLEKFCDEPFIYIIGDDSDTPASNEIQQVAFDYGAYYVRLPDPPPGTPNGSPRAAEALMSLYNAVCNDYDRLVFLDHDLFPVRRFTFDEVMGDAEIGGIAQSAYPPRDGRKYLWPGLLFLRNREEYRDLVDLRGTHDLGFDVGGGTHVLMEHVGHDRCRFIGTAYEENPYFRDGCYHVYATHDDGRFIHFINGSGWNTAEQSTQEQRMRALFQLLEEKVR